MNKLLTLTLLAGLTFAQSDRRREAIKEEDELFQTREKLVLLRKEYDKIRIERWQDKRNSVAKKEAFQEIWEELRRDVEKLQSSKSQKEETLMRLESQANESEKELQASKDRMKEFGVQISDKLSEFNKFMSSAFPMDQLKQQQVTDDFVSALANSNYLPTADLISESFQQQLEIYQKGEERNINRQQMAMQGFARMQPGMKEKLTTQMVAGWKITLGGVYQGFASTETEDAAILAKTGRTDAQAWDWVESILPEKRANLQKAGALISAGNNEAPLLIPMDVQLKKAIGEGYSSALVSSFWKDLGEELKGAGFVIYGMGLIAVLALMILADKVYLFVLRGRHSKSFAKEVYHYIEEGNIKKAHEISKGNMGSVPEVFKAILKAARKGKTREEAENAAYEAILHETPMIEKNITTINIFAAAAPLLGLLGTVSGMVNLFAAITLHGTSDPKIMAAGIAEALLSTKWGLIVAIPMLLIYNWVNNRAAKMISNMEKYSARLINKLYGKPEEDSTPEPVEEVEAPTPSNEETEEVAPSNV